MSEKNTEDSGALRFDPEYMDLYYGTFDNATYAFYVNKKDGKVIHAPSNAKWMKGKHITTVTDWIMRHNGEINKMEPTGEV